MIDHRQRQLATIAKERRAILLKDATIDQVRNGTWPAKAVWFWAVGMADAPGTAGRETEHWSDR